MLNPLGIAVLSYDRRETTPPGADTPLETQATDAVAALRALGEHLGAPVSLFGFSQGAWAATLTAAGDVAAHLVVVGHCGVTPADQMRYHVDEVLRRNGFSAEDRTRARTLRIWYEQALRGAADVARVNEMFADAADCPWFTLTYLPDQVPPGHAWKDMDYDPVAPIAQVRVPTLTIWGEEEEVVPLDVSRHAWQAAPGPVTQLVLPGCGHWPIVGSAEADWSGWHDNASASARYEQTLLDWFRSAVR